MKPLNRYANIIYIEGEVSFYRPLLADHDISHVYNQWIDKLTPSTRSRLERLLALDGWRMHEDRTRTDVDDEVRVFEYVWEGE